MSAPDSLGRLPMGAALKSVDGGRQTALGGPQMGQSPTGTPHHVLERHGVGCLRQIALEGRERDKVSYKVTAVARQPWDVRKWGTLTGTPVAHLKGADGDASAEGDKLPALKGAEAGARQPWDAAEGRSTPQARHGWLYRAGDAGVGGCLRPSLRAGSPPRGAWTAQKCPAGRGARHPPAGQPGRPARARPQIDSNRGRRPC